ncbi:peptidase M50 [Haloterrigena turkmenica DSM 5511]|uniref:Peptidase M50 n=1 Tax=Haloterrigena turkmenica (strain ATCC 51198 / DSM 5511 / JCM 9101 / NCIMB 13204 / VKM B-1734 / 4k) TaxID=543526 RepID=D2RRF0_HALTV|nr:metalloprotease [Haloterrigena turkmenica]ADB60510.1 peptidase M50 [Haloterrigena turkmenica DSM 5511]
MSTRTRQRAGSGPELTFSDRELIDLAVAWLTLSVAFSLIFVPIHRGGSSVGYFLGMVGLSLVTVGVAFLLHELAHKVVAIEHGQLAEFRADYQMLFLALMGALVGFLFAAPGAVYHRGRITQRENAMIALAGPVTNHLLAVMFLPLVLLPAPLGTIGQMGVWINLVLAAFNMIPFGPLDGKSVYDWHKGVFALVFVPSVLLAGYVVLFVNPF